MKTSIDEILDSIISKCREKVEPSEKTLALTLTDEDNCRSSPSWQYSCLILDTFLNVHATILEIESTQSEEESCIEVLSIQAQAYIFNCSQLLIGFGVLPYLLPGIGVPTKLRTVNKHAEQVLTSDRILSHIEQFLRLAHVITTVYKVIKHPILFNSIALKNVADILAASLQLCKPPIAKPNESSLVNNKGLTLAQYEEVLSIRKELLPIFENEFLPSLPKPSLVTSLFLIGAAEKPKWMRQSCNEILIKLLLEPNGLILVSSSLLDTTGSRYKGKLTGLVAELMLSALSQNPDPIYLTSMCSQCFQMTASSGKHENEDELARIALFCAITLSNKVIRNIDSSRELIWTPIFAPILETPETVQISNVKKCATLGAELCKLFIPMSAAPDSLKTDFGFILGPLFQIMLASKSYLNRKVHDMDVVQTVNNYISNLEELFTSVLLLLENNKVCTLNEFCIDLLLHQPSYAINEESLTLSSCESYEELERISLLDQCTLFAQWLLQNVQLKKCNSVLFSQLLAYKSDGKSKSSSNSKTELENSKSSKNLIVEEPCFCPRKLIALKLLGDLGADDSILSGFCEPSSNEDVPGDSQKETLSLVRIIMDRLTCSAEDEPEELASFQQTLLYALGILGTLCETASKDSPLWDELRVFVPQLQKLSYSCETPGCLNVPTDVATMAEQILISVETRGAGVSHGEKVKALSKYESALRDIGNPLLPVRGHGLLQMRKLIDAKDKEAAENETFLLQLFIKELSNDDSYIYLMAIEGLASLGNRFHGQVMKVMMSEYEKDRLRGVNDDPDEVIKFRMKIGEVLVRLVKRLGEFCPLYRVELTNLFFRMVKDQEPLIRASALSNFAEVVHLLKFSVAVVITEVSNYYF